MKQQEVGSIIFQSLSCRLRKTEKGDITPESSSPSSEITVKGLLHSFFGSTEMSMLL
jgi:hypothetical protein